jgi:hypothetical protein
MRHLSTTDFLSVCILLAHLSWTAKKVIPKKRNNYISHYEIWLLECLKWREVY